MGEIGDRVTWEDAQWWTLVNFSTATRWSIIIFVGLLSVAGSIFGVAAFGFLAWRYQRAKRRLADWKNTTHPDALSGIPLATIVGQSAWCHCEPNNVYREGQLGRLFTNDVVAVFDRGEIARFESTVFPDHESLDPKTDGFMLAESYQFEAGDRIEVRDIVFKGVSLSRESSGGAGEGGAEWESRFTAGEKRGTSLILMKASGTLHTLLEIHEVNADVRAANLAVAMRAALPREEEQIAIQRPPPATSRGEGLDL